uniref:DUF3444 domain-containing protein n=1 Tax=Solanum lycopersicum TaxID=4081 RepID=A0A3Q7IGQ2_SOLLC
MSRYYTHIHDKISKNPFKVKFRRLNSKNNSELHPINWVGSCFLKTSADFRIGKHDINKTFNTFPPQGQVGERGWRCYSNFPKKAGCLGFVHSLVY